VIFSMDKTFPMVCPFSSWKAQHNIPVEGTSA
jgi:hypothetical protein